MDQDEETIRTRLTVNERPLRKMTARFHKWTRALSTGTPQEIEHHFQNLMHEVTYYEISIAKTNLLTDMTERERMNYDQQQKQTEESIAASHDELEALSRELEDAKQERANKIRYDQLAVEVSQFPSRESSQESIAGLQAEIQELENEAIQQSMAMELRKKQFFTALLCLQSIQGSIEEDQQEEERKLFLKRTHDDDDDDDDDIEEEEGGFIEAMEGVESDTVAVSTSTPLQPLENGLQRVFSQDEQSMSAKTNGPSSPVSGRSLAFDGAGRSEDGGVFVMDLQQEGGGSTGSMGATPAGTPGRAHHPSPTPPLRSLTGTPNPADMSMNVDTFL